MKMYTELEIAEIIGNANTEKAIEKALSDVPHERSKECDYYNIYIFLIAAMAVLGYIWKNEVHANIQEYSDL